MSDSVTLLATIGADADLMGAAAAELREWLESTATAPALRSALLDGNVGKLRELLRAPDIVCCIIDPAEEEDEEEEEGGEEEEEDEDQPSPTRQPKSRG